MPLVEAHTYMSRARDGPRLLGKATACLPCSEDHVRTCCAMFREGRADRLALKTLTKHVKDPLGAV